MSNETEFVRLVGNERRVGDTLASISYHWRGDEENFLFVSPHDDDAALGAGLFMQLARRENVDVHILIVTDGSMGYCSQEEKDKISDIRKAETYACYKSLGISEDNIIWLGYPDCTLTSYKGRKKANGCDSTGIAGYMGLQNSFTYWLRQIRPSQCFLPTSSDLHPDHKIVHEEFLISLFHAAGGIWPEIGSPIQEVPHIHEMGVYCDFPSPPNLRIKTPESYLDKKLAAIGKFESQKQIASLIEVVRNSGPFEYLRALEFKLYQPRAYYDRFEARENMPFIR